MQFCKLTGSANVFFKFIFECRQSITLEDMEAPNLCRPPLGDASNGAPLGDISNVDHHSRMTPVPMPGNCEHNFLLFITMSIHIVDEVFLLLLNGCNICSLTRPYPVWISLRKGKSC
uniref:Uncharacterized protein n=2 Tax=Aegilops tauschii subsp. strangulata TaxID=200361 RepID=A0A453KTU1_AEGTS